MHSRDEATGSLTEFRLQVQKGYKEDAGWFDKLTPAEQAKCSQKQGFWWYGNALIIPDSSGLRNQCLHELHNCSYSGHLGVTKTQKAVDRLYWWKGVRSDVVQHIRKCSHCQKNKTNSNQKPGGLLQLLQIPGRRWESIRVDLITELPETKSGNTQIVVFVDRLSKMVHFAAVVAAFTAVQWHGCMCTPFSDCMACNVTLSVIETPCSPVGSGKSSQSHLALDVQCQLHSIQPVMDRQKGLTEHLRICSGTL